MAEPLKNLYNNSFLQAVYEHARTCGLTTSKEQWSRHYLLAPWSNLELKPRMYFIAQMLHEGGIKELQQVLDLTESLRPLHLPNMGFLGMFLPHMVEHYFFDHPKALQALAQITSVSSSEFAVRPFLNRKPAELLPLLDDWSKSTDYHIRRLASEGSRPLLPWAMQLPAYRLNPFALAPMLHRLLDDPVAYVSRSASNHFNDISKDHPQWTADQLALAKKRGVAHPSTLRHAARTLIKKAHPATMELFGLTPMDCSLKQQSLDKTHIVVGSALEYSVELNISEPGTLRLAYAIYYMKANRTQNRKQFHWLEREISGAQTLIVKKRISFVPLTTRKLYTGAHKIALVVNGLELPPVEFHLET